MAMRGVSENELLQVHPCVSQHASVLLLILSLLFLPPLRKCRVDVFPIEIEVPSP